MSNRNNFGSPNGDWIARIDRNRSVSTLVSSGLYYSGNMAFGSGGDFGSELYIGNNGYYSDNYVFRANTTGSLTIFADLYLPSINSGNPSGGLAFDTSGQYDYDMFVGNTGRMDAVIRVTSEGTTTPFHVFNAPLGSISPGALAFGDGDVFEQYLFVTIRHQTSSGMASGVYVLSPTGKLSAFATSNNSSLISYPGLGGERSALGDYLGTNMYITDENNGTILAISPTGQVDYLLTASTHLAASYLTKRVDISMLLRAVQTESSGYLKHPVPYLSFAS